MYPTGLRGSREAGGCPDGSVTDSATSRRELDASDGGAWTIDAEGVDGAEGTVGGEARSDNQCWKSDREWQREQGRACFLVLGPACAEAG